MAAQKDGKNSQNKHGASYAGRAVFDLLLQIEREILSQKRERCDVFSHLLHKP
jgi:hypothetical protein